MTTTEHVSAADAFVSSYKEGAGIPGTGNTVTGAAMHRDLYRQSEDPAAVRKRDAGQARVLGLGFMVFFAILSCISFWINGALYPYVAVLSDLELPIEGVAYPAEDEPAEGAEEAQEGRLHEGAEFVVGYAPVDGREQSAAPTGVSLGKVVNDPDRELEADELAVHVSVNKDWTSRVIFPGNLAKEFPPTTLTYGSSENPEGFQLLVLPGRQHAWKNAKLMGFMPTRCLLYLGLVMGALGLIVPALLVPFYKVWMRYVTAPLGFVNTRIILGIVFFLVLTPMALIARVFGKDRLRRAPLPKGESYWVPREQQRDHRHFEKGF